MVKYTNNNISNNLTAVEEPRFDFQGCEINTVVSIQFSKTKKLFISSFYNPSAADPLPLHQLDECLGSGILNLSNWFYVATSTVAA